LFDKYALLGDRFEFVVDDIDPVEFPLQVPCDEVRGK